MYMIVYVNSLQRHKMIILINTYPLFSNLFHQRPLHWLREVARSKDAAYDFILEETWRWHVLSLMVWLGESEHIFTNTHAVKQYIRIYM